MEKKTTKSGYCYFKCKKDMRKKKKSVNTKKHLKRSRTFKNDRKTAKKYKKNKEYIYGIKKVKFF